MRRWPYVPRLRKRGRCCPQYGDVYRFHAGVLESHADGDSLNTAALGCERFLVPNMKKLAYNVLLGYKLYAATGESRVPIKQLVKQYSRHGSELVQHG